MAENPVKSLLSDEQGKNMGKELRESMRMKKEAADTLKSPTPAPTPAAPAKPAPVDKVNPAGGYGQRPGEKRLDVTDMVKPLGQMHKGGTVPKTGPYVMKKNEHVLTPEKHDKLKKAMGLAADALSHEEGPEPVEQPPAKIDKEMNVRRLDDKSFHIRHKHKPPHDMPEHDEEYSVPDIKALKKHMEDHFGKEEDEHESAGVEAAEKATGME